VFPFYLAADPIWCLGDPLAGVISIPLNERERNPTRGVVPNEERDQSETDRSFALLRMTRRGESDLSLRSRWPETSETLLQKVLDGVGLFGFI
jgi:hypothetical protein